MNTPDHIAMQAMLQPTRLAVMEFASGKRWSYAALDRWIAQCAGALSQSYGCGPGSRVAALARNCAHLILLQYSCARIGAIFSPLNWRLSPREVEMQIAEAEPSVVFGGEEMTRLGIGGITFEALDQAIEAAPPFATANSEPDRPSLLLFTSGTSGRQKGVLLTERNLVSNAMNFTMLGRMTYKSVFLIDSPMFHTIGMVASVRPAMAQGGAILVSDGFDPKRTLQRLADKALSITHYFCVPQMVQRLRQQPDFKPEQLRHLTAIFTGGAPMPPEDTRAWLDDRIALVNGFGMSETGTVFGMPLDPDRIRTKLGSVGIAPPGLDAKIVDDCDRECPRGTAGELLLKGESIFGGYWNLPDETANSFSQGGWFRTGDIAVQDNDGFYWLVDRKKDMFISGGENVYPAEIESALAELKGIGEAAVVGVPDDQWGEVGHLAIVTTLDTILKKETVLEHLATRLARYKLPKYVSFVESLPRTSSGKLRKTELRKLLAAVSICNLETDVAMRVTHPRNGAD